MYKHAHRQRFPNLRARQGAARPDRLLCVRAMLAAMLSCGRATLARSLAAGARGLAVASKGHAAKRQRPQGRPKAATKGRKRDQVVFPVFGATQAPLTERADIDALEALLRQDVRLLGSYAEQVGPDDEDLPMRHEIALVGRSNVGKSSLLNQLLQRPGLAPTSRTPGRTGQVLFYGLGKAHQPPAVFVDMPGYGFAKRSQERQEEWVATIAEYLQGRPRDVLRRAVLLVDSRLALPQGVAAAMEGMRRGAAAAGAAASSPGKGRASATGASKYGRNEAERAAMAADLAASFAAAPPAPAGAEASGGRGDGGAAAEGDLPFVSMAPEDCEVAAMLEDSQVPWMVVFTKCDTVSPAERAAISSAIETSLGLRRNGPLPVFCFVSARTGEGVNELRTLLAGSAGLGPLPTRSRKSAMRRMAESAKRLAAEAAVEGQGAHAPPAAGLPIELPVDLLKRGARASEDERQSMLREAIKSTSRR